MVKERLKFHEILKEALKIPYKNPNFIIFTFLTSLPLFCFMLAYETLLQQTLIETAKIFRETPYCYFCYDDDGAPLGAIERLLKEISHRIFLLGLLYVGVLHFLDLLNTIATVDATSEIYSEERIMNLKDMLSRAIKETRFRGPLITSLCTLSLTSLLVVGLVSLAIHMYIASMYVLFMGLFGLTFIALLIKYLEWKAIWNMGIVISVLDEKDGDVAVVVSSYLSRGRRRFGFLLVFVFFLWGLGLRVACLYINWQEGDGRKNTVGILCTSLLCLGNVMKWVVFVVFFYDCKHCNSESSVDLEEHTRQSNREELKTVQM